MQPPARPAASQHPAGRRSSDGRVVLEVTVCLFHRFLCLDSHVGQGGAGGPRPTGRYIDSLDACVFSTRNLSVYLSIYPLEKLHPVSRRARTWQALSSQVAPTYRATPVSAAKYERTGMGTRPRPRGPETMHNEARHDGLEAAADDSRPSRDATPVSRQIAGGLRRVGARWRCFFALISAHQSTTIVQQRP